MLELHPLAEIFRGVFAKGFESLKADIRACGVQTPVLTLGGKVVDGERRLLACTQLGIECPAEEWDKKNSLIALLLRRHEFVKATISQRALIAGRLWELHDFLPVVDQRTKLAYTALLGISTTSTSHATKVLRSGAPELVVSVAGGMISIEAAARISGLDPDEQRSRLADPPVKSKSRSRKLSCYLPVADRLEDVAASVQKIKKLASVSPTFIKIFALRGAIDDLETRVAKLTHSGRRTK